MKKIKMIAGTITVCLLVAVIYSCNKESKLPGQTTPGTTSTEPTQQSARMGNNGASPSQLYAVANAPTNANLYSLSSPPGVLSAALVSGFFVKTTQVTNATGIAFTNDTIIISTGSTSNFPNKLLIYPYPSIGSPLTAPGIVNCPNITDIEHNEYNSTLYGILGGLHIVAINRVTGAITIDLSPVVPPGKKVTGLCNYNALLSYCISDGTPAPDNFYSYGPGGGLSLAFQFSTDWDGSGGENSSQGAGTQYVDGFGWEIVTAKRFHKHVNHVPLFAGSFSSMPSPASAIFADVTSD